MPSKSPSFQRWSDTSEILDRLEARHPNPPLYSKTPLQKMVCALVEIYSDEFAVTPAMHTRWATEDSERYTCARFGAMMGSAKAGHRAADQMVKGRYAVGATPEAGPAIEEHLTDLLAALSTHFDSHDFLLGERMSLADCALMGRAHQPCESEEILRGPDGFCQRCDFEEPGELLIKISKTARFEGYTSESATEKKVLRNAFEEGLASYARPIFIRILPQMEITETFKHRKVDLVRDGFDPTKLGDRLYFRDPEKGRYVALDVGAFERIQAAQTRL